jgi:hypothetical protein
MTAIPSNHKTNLKTYSLVVLDKNSFRSPLTVRLYSRLMNQIDPAYSLPFGTNMKRICEHCGALIIDNAYRVASEQKGIIPLDMIVGSRCLMEAKSLQPSCGGNQC